MKYKKWLGMLVWGAIFVLWLIRVIPGTDFSDPDVQYGFVVAMVFWTGSGVLVWYLIKTKDQRRKRRASRRAESRKRAAFHKAEQEKRRAAAAIERQKRIEKENEVRREKAWDNCPVWAKVVASSANTVSRGNVVGTGTRMLVGGILAGQAGAMLGAVTV